MKLPLNNSYALLMIMLTPKKDPIIKKALIKAAKNNQIQWEKLLYQANVQMCTPLWYSQLKDDQFLSYLPTDLVDYLLEIYHSNQIRNQQLQEALLTLLVEFNKADIDTLLLKGAATFCDQLFVEEGSRFMGDLDILVPEDKLESCQKILRDLAYKKLPNENIESDELATNVRHHQLPRYILPNTVVAVEIHFKISYGLAGRMIPVQSAWKTCQPIVFKGQKTSVLSADHKVLLNTVHALLPYREFIRGHISLLHLNEFVRLGEHYSDNINWTLWFQVAQQYSLHREFKAYRSLAIEYMNTSIDISVAQKETLGVNHRILFIGHYDACLEEKPSTYHQIKRLFYRIYYYMNLPKWMWNNLCYAPHWKNIPTRFFFCLKKILSINSWLKI